MEDTEFDGRYVRIEKSTFERLLVAANNHFARLVRYTSPAHPEQTISDWLADLEAARTGPSPTTEPGDLIVKLARGEFWLSTVNGWQELAPVFEVVADKPAGPQKVTAGGYCGKHGLYQGTLGCLGCAAGDPPRERFFGRSVVEDELDRLRKDRDEYPTPDEARAATMKHFEARAERSSRDVIRDAERELGRKLAEKIKIAEQIQDEMARLERSEEAQPDDGTIARRALREIVQSRHIDPRVRVAAAGMLL